MELLGKHVVVTGAGSGIGRACAIRFAEQGARVVVPDRDAHLASSVADKIGGLAVRADVSVESDIRGLITQARELMGPIDLFFSNAGLHGPAGGPETSDDALASAWQVNVMAHVWAVRSLLPDWMARGEGFFVCSASAAGLLTEPSALAYSVTKHAAVAFAEWISINYSDAGIKVSCLCPQGVRTEMFAETIRDPIAAAPLLAAEVLEPDDVAAVVLNAIADERFLILPHGDVARHMAFKGLEPERWLEAMRRLRRRALVESPPT